MRARQVTKTLIGLTAVLSLCLTTLTSPASASEVSGTIDVKHPTNPITIELPSTSTGPCGEPDDPVFEFELDGDDEEGIVSDFVFSSKGYAQSPWTGIWYQRDLSVVFWAILYDLKSSPPPWTYHFHGLIIIIINVYTVGHPTDPGFPDCTKTDLKCTFAFGMHVKGILYNFNTDAPDLDPDAVIEFTGDTDHEEGSPLTAITECGGEVGTFDGVHINMNLVIQDFA